jgi:Fe-S cluster assembly protein SufB
MSKNTNEQSNLKQIVLPVGLNEDVIRQISSIKNEPAWVLEYRLKAYKQFKNLLKNNKLPSFANLKLPKIDFQAISYLATLEPKKQKTTNLVELKQDWISTLNKSL